MAAMAVVAGSFQTYLILGTFGNLPVTKIVVKKTGSFSSIVTVGVRQWKQPLFQLKKSFKLTPAKSETGYSKCITAFYNGKPVWRNGVSLKRLTGNNMGLVMITPSTNNKLGMPAGGQTFSGIHTHADDSYPMFSWDDVYTLYNINSRVAPHNVGQASFLLSCRDESDVFQTYAIVFENIGTTLNQFFTNPLNIGCTHKEIIDMMHEKLGKSFEEEYDNGTSNYERAFLRSVFGLNVSLYKANNTLTNWSKLFISNNSPAATVDSANCN
ncbi:MAG TPA: hypothetical protein PLS00_17810 [Niabella sp.]|nr:hypothetical protein [Niabella sp.]